MNKLDKEEKELLDPSPIMNEAKTFSMPLTTGAILSLVRVPWKGCMQPPQLM